MSKHKRKRKHSGGHHAAAGPPPEKIIAELEQRVTELETAAADQTGAIWGATHKLLLTTGHDLTAIGRIIVARDVAALTALVRALSHGEVTAIDVPQQSDAPRIDIPRETLTKAMHAFRKRLKLTRLDHESKLGVGPMTSGRKADVDAILPPREFSAEVWEALVLDGQLKDAGQGFYALGEE